MSDNHEVLKKAIAAVSVRDVLRKFNLQDIPERDGVKFSSVLRTDLHPSCEIRNNRYHDWSRDEHLDSYDLFQRLVSDSKQAFVPFIEMAGLGHELRSSGRSHNGKNGNTPKKETVTFDWTRDVKQLDENDIAELSEWRGYTKEFCRWLSDQNLIGRKGQHWSIPVFHEGRIVAASIRVAKESWPVEPKLRDLGIKVPPLIIGDLGSAKLVVGGESQWDVFGVLDRLGIHNGQSIAGIAARGASNGKLLSCFCGPAELYLLPQRDEPNKKWMRDALQAFGRSVKILEPPEPHFDVNDWLKAVKGSGELLAAIEAAPTRKPESAVDPLGNQGCSPAESVILTHGPEVDRLVTEYATNLDDLPEPMRDVAFRGIAGEIVEILEKHCEACREALLLQLLVMVGNIFGRSMRLYASRDVFPNEYSIIVGATARGRKGTSLAMVEGLLWQIDPNWLKHRRVDGIQSGEGIIHQVRDEAWGRDPKAKHSKGDPFKEVLLDVGVSDKRLMIVEEEFASLLKAAQRRGSTITEILRKTWESPICLRNSSKNSAQIATAPHISLIAHCTRDELIQTLKNVDLSNGFANRFLWCASYMARQMANVEFLDWREHQAITARLTSIFKTFSNSGEPRRFTRDQAAHRLWEEKYSDLISRKRAANIDGIAARDTTHILKLSLILAALDHSCLITRDHLEAAFEITEYSERSAQWIFNSNTGNRTANRMLAALRINPNGLSKSEISRELGRNVASVDIEQGLRVLMQSNLIKPRVRRVIGKEDIPIWKAI